MRNVVILGVGATWAAPSYAQALSCAGRDATVCQAVNEMVPAVNAQLGSTVLSSASSRAAFRPAAIYAAMMNVRNAAVAGGCAIDGWSGGEYDASAGAQAWSGALADLGQSPFDAAGAVTLAPATWSGAADTRLIGLDVGVHNAAGQIAADVDDDGFKAGTWHRLVGSRGVFLALVGTCPGDAGDALDPWYSGDLPGFGSPDPGVPGCTDAGALNFDPLATSDDGSCIVVPATTDTYAGPAGPDLSDEGWVLCSGTASAGTAYTSFYPPCAGASEVRFACSVDADADAEYASGPVPGANFTDSTCDDWSGGSNSNFGSGRILSIDDTDPGCGNFNVLYDLYMDMVSPQWGCAGTANTHVSGGRMWMYARDPRVVAGCTDPDAHNYDPAANLDDGSCDAPVVPGFVGVLGPDLSSEGFLQCAGTDSASTTSSQFYALCEGWDEIRFGCSTGADATAEFTSTAFSITGADLTDGVCEDWVGGSNSAFQVGHIVSVDDSDPTCGQFNVGYDLYMDMVSPQWGCAGSINTHLTGGRMWAWVR